MEQNCQDMDKLFNRDHLQAFQTFKMSIIL